MLGRMGRPGAWQSVTRIVVTRDHVALDREVTAFGKGVCPLEGRTRAGPRATSSLAPRADCSHGGGTVSGQHGSRMGAAGDCGALPGAPARYHVWSCLCSQGAWRRAFLTDVGTDRVLSGFLCFSAGSSMSLTTPRT